MLVLGLAEVQSFFSPKILFNGCRGSSPEVPYSFPHNYECRLYFKCEFKTYASVLYWCDEDQSFDYEKQGCIPRDEEHCAELQFRNPDYQPERCPYGFEGQHTPYKTDCTKYYICNPGKVLLVSCPEDKSFSPENARCIPYETSYCDSLKATTQQPETTTVAPVTEAETITEVPVTEAETTIVAPVTEDSTTTTTVFFLNTIFGR